MFVGIICGTEDRIVPPKKLKTKKSKPKLGAAYGMTKVEKRRLSKEIPVEYVIKEHIQKADPTVRASLEGILNGYRAIFPSKLFYGPLPKRQLDHEIETVTGEAPPYQSPFRLSSIEMEELRR